MKAAAKADLPGHDQLRLSNRRSVKVATYNEDDDDFDDTTMVQSWTYFEGPGIDQILDARRKDGDQTYSAKKDDYEYLIKWKEQAYLHATWQDYASLESLEGAKKLQNFHKALENYHVFMDDARNSREDKENATLDRIKRLDDIEDFKKMERIVDVCDSPARYLVKWKKVAYDGCTWEDAALVSERAPVALERFHARTRKLPFSDKHESRKLITRISSQPDYITGGNLFKFQLDGLSFLAVNWSLNRNVILADEMGLGKTIQTISFLSWLYHERHQEGPFLIVVPLTTLAAWAAAFEQWAPDLNVVQYTGNTRSRERIREIELFVAGNPNRTKFNALLTTYEYIMQDQDRLKYITWNFMAIDEAHRLKNRDSKLYHTLMEFKSLGRLLITGTPIQNNLTELSSLMHFLNPTKDIIDPNIDMQSETSGSALTEVTKAIQPYITRRVKKDVATDLPSKTEKVIRIELSDHQVELYRNILTRNYAALTAASQRDHVSLANTMIELKKVSDHPYLFPFVEERILNGPNGEEEYLKGRVTASGKMMVLDHLLNKLKADGHRVLIFSQLVTMLDILSAYLQVRGHAFQRIDGNKPVSERDAAMSHFNEEGSKDFCFLLSTRAGGLGINLATADTVILFDSDWNPQADLQAMARAHRIGQKKPVTIYRFVSKDTVEEEVLERARNKLLLEYIMIQKGITDSKKEREELAKQMADRGVSTEDAKANDDISRLLKKRGQKMFEQKDNQKKLEALDIDAVLKNAEEHDTEQPEGVEAGAGDLDDFLKQFEYTDVKIEDRSWDDIIPQDQLEKIKREEQERRSQEMVAKLTAQDAPRTKTKRPADTDDHDQPQRSAKKRARTMTAEHAEDLDDIDSEADEDPMRELSREDKKRLAESFTKWGLLEERQDLIIRDARLVGRDVGLIKRKIQEFIDVCQAKVTEEQDRLERIEKDENRHITKADKKTISFEHDEVKRVNPEAFLDRPRQLRVLRQTLSTQAELGDFRVPGATKEVEQYSCEWGPREDGMLCVGIDRHGWNAWKEIRDDPELKMTDRMFLDEQTQAEKSKRNKDDKARTPGAVHLVRRGRYLLQVLEAFSEDGDPAAQKAVENYHRNNKKHNAAIRHSEEGRRISGSPAVAGSKKSLPNGTSTARTSDRSETSKRTQIESSQHKSRLSDADRPQSSSSYPRAERKHGEKSRKPMGNGNLRGSPFNRDRDHDRLHSLGAFRKSVDRDRSSHKKHDRISSDRGSPAPPRLGTSERDHQPKYKPWYESHYHASHSPNLTATMNGVHKDKNVNGKRERAAEDGTREHGIDHTSKKQHVSPPSDHNSPLERNSSAAGKPSKMAAPKENGSHVQPVQTKDPLRDEVVGCLEPMRPKFELAMKQSRAHHKGAKEYKDTDPAKSDRERLKAKTVMKAFVLLLDKRIHEQALEAGPAFQDKCW